MSSAKDELIPPPQKNIDILLVAARTVGFEIINDKVIERLKAEVVECFSPLRSIV